MAGEIEEPFRLDFQATLLHSGSISFGRFESESLSWERRSIFSHNRYLEEVEKYSKPGSVTEKKAYFEAEFKRKALLKQRSSECQDRGELPTVSNDELLDFGESGNCNESPCSSNLSKCHTETEIEHHEKGDNVCFDERISDSGYDEDTASQHSESQKYEFHPVTTQDVAGNTRESIGLTHVDLVEHVNVSSADNNDSSLASQPPEKDHDSISSAPETTFLPKAKPEAEKKLTRSRSTSKTQVNVDRPSKQVLNGASKSSMKPRTSESKVLLVKRTEKKPPSSANPQICAGVKTSKAQTIVKEVKSDKPVKVKSRTSLPEKPLSGVRPNVYRSKETHNLSKSHIVPSTTGSIFKTDQQTKTKKQEKQAAEMKQFRQSLNFKAKPLPSFYNGTSDQHKVTPVRKTPNQPRPSSQSMATRTQNQQRPSSQSMATRHAKNSFKSGVPSNIRPGSSTSSTNRIRLSDHVPERKDKEKGKDTKFYKQKDPDTRDRKVGVAS